MKKSPENKELKKIIKEGVKNDREFQELNSEIYELSMDWVRRYLNIHSAEILADAMEQPDFEERYDKLATGNGKNIGKRAMYVCGRIIEYIRTAVPDDDEDDGEYMFS
jgi:hypothetical protein